VGAPRRGKAQGMRRKDDEVGGRWVAGGGVGGHFRLPPAPFGGSGASSGAPRPFAFEGFASASCGAAAEWVSGGVPMTRCSNGSKRSRIYEIITFRPLKFVINMKIPKKLDQYKKNTKSKMKISICGDFYSFIF